MLGGHRHPKELINFGPSTSESSVEAGSLPEQDKKKGLKSRMRHLHLFARRQMSCERKAAIMFVHGRDCSDSSGGAGMFAGDWARQI